MAKKKKGKDEPPPEPKVKLILTPEEKKKIKGMNKAQKKAFLEQLAAERKKQEEEQLMAETFERRAAYKVMINDLKKKDDEEQEIRNLVLKNIVDQFAESTALKNNQNQSIQEDEEWQTYMRTDFSPDPRQPPELTCALYRWEMEEENDNKFDLAKVRDSQIFPLMNVLNDILKFPLNYTARQLTVFKEVKKELFEEAMRTLERSSWRWATIPAPRAPPVPEVHAHKVNQHALAIWLLPPGPPKMIKPNDPPSEPIEIPFSSLGLTVTLPGGHNWYGVAIRVLRLMLDVLSPSNPLYANPYPAPITTGRDLFEFTKFQFNEILVLRDEQAKARAAFYADIKMKMDLFFRGQEDKSLAKSAEPVDIFALKIADPEPVPLPREILFTREEDAAKEYLDGLRSEVAEDEINLRKYRLCGGILNLELLRQPPRPKTMERQISLTFVEAEDKMIPLDFYEDYVPPPPPEAGAVRAPEEIEAEIRRQEAALEKLILVNIHLTDTILWLEPPVVCGWDKKRSTWTTNDVHDIKYNEDKFTLAFRTGILKPLAFALPKYTNLPYQGWELKPNATNTGAIVTIMGAIIVAEFEVTDEGIKVKSIQNGATKALQDMVGHIFPIKILIKRFQEGGVDFFPTEDASLLMEGSCNKIPTLENHLYHSIAHTCTSYNFTWSRWNVAAGRNAIVLQYREYLFSDIENLEILHITPLQAVVVKATEISQEYSTEPIPDLDFYPDLYSLLAGIGTNDAKNILTDIRWQLVEYIRELLWAVKPCSYS